MARTLHESFSWTQKWDITHVPYSLQFDSAIGDQLAAGGVGPDPDGDLWTTYVWREKPEEPIGFEEYYRRGDEGITREDILGTCKVVFGIQPPWILGQADFRSFIKTGVVRHTFHA